MINMVRFSEIKDINHKDFEEAIRIYEESFPSNERQFKDTIKKRIKGNLYQMFIGRLKDKVVFMALLYPLKNTDFVLLDYMVTEENFRNKGIGTNFIKNILEEIASKYLILEVENPRCGNNKEQRERRVKFYKRLGAKEMKNVRYILPPLSGNIPTEMILMILPNYGEGKIDGHIVKKLIIQLYKELYGRNEDDVLLNSFINKINNHIELV
jgi:GNAT superfamily N-acetyltransferase